MTLPETQTDAPGVTQIGQLVACAVCGHQSHSLYSHLASAHAMVPEAYAATYPTHPLLSEYAQRIHEEKIVGAQIAYVPSTVKSKAAFTVGFGDGNNDINLVSYTGFEAEHGVPEVDSDYVFQEEITRSFLILMDIGHNVYLFGPTGSGKTTLPEQFAARTGRPFFRQQFYEDMEPTDLMGNYVVVDGTMEYMYSGLAKAIQQPSVVCYDEFDSGNPAVSAVANALLEGKPLVLTNNGGERIEAHPDCKFVGTGNTNGMGDETGLYTSTSVQSFATMNRWHGRIEIFYMPQEKEVELLTKKFGKMIQQVEKLSDMVTVANLIRDGFVNGRTTAVLSTRQLINWAHYTYILRNPFQAFNLSFASSLGNEDKAICTEMYQKKFGNAGMV